MSSPMLTVVVLAVLWLIVVVPMVLRRNDERAGERSVPALRLRDARARIPARCRCRSAAEDESSGEVLLRTGRSEPTVHVSGAVNRRPVPASRESLMYPPDRHDMSEARRRMLARRRRSLTTLAAGSLVFFFAGLLTASMLAWAGTALFVLGLTGYLFFLRSQALRDRDRRETRLQRASERPSLDYEATRETLVIHHSESAVRIDEDDVDLDHLDTVDLTGLYSEVEFEDHAIRRAG